MTPQQIRPIFYDQAGWLMQIHPEKHRTTYLTIKRGFDLLIAVTMLPLLLPVFILCAILIRLESPGPIFFTQERTGKDGRRFRMFKFRTMVANAEELKKELVPLNEDGELAQPVKLENDPRITRMGRFLRKTSLDELPQVINVINGEMSWVGPRPTSFGLKSYRLRHTERLEVMPGITGLWQLYGRGDTDFDTWLYWDSIYIEKQCLWLDFQILGRTVFAVLKQQGSR